MFNELPRTYFDEKQEIRDLCVMSLPLKLS